MNLKCEVWVAQNTRPCLIGWLDNRPFIIECASAFTKGSYLSDPYADSEHK